MGACALVALAAAVVALAPLDLTARADAPVSPCALAGYVCPDIASDPPDNQFLQTYDVGGQTRLLLRFDAYVHNVSPGARSSTVPDITNGPAPGALEIVASGNDGASPPHLADVRQRVYSTTRNQDGTYAHVDVPLPNAAVSFETSDGHDHFHVAQVARYSLWDASRSAEVAPAAKVGFCLGDSRPHGQDPNGPWGQGAFSARPWYTSDPQYGTTSPYNACDRGDPTAAQLSEGISYGWVDEYSSDLPFQWVDISDTEPGRYWLRADVNAQLFDETDAGNDGPAWATEMSVVPGYVARTVAPPPVPGATPSAIALDATAYSVPNAAGLGPRRFTIRSAPAHGSLSVAPGVAFEGPDVTYTPDPGYSGPDSFTYSAADAASAFPLHPVLAAVALSVATASPAPQVAVSGPSTVQVGTKGRYRAAVTGTAAGVRWSLTGAAAGRRGTISPAGLYAAPARIPRGARVTIVATSTSLPGVAGHKTILVTRTPASVAAPLPRIVFPSGARLLGPPTAARLGRALVVAVVARRLGVLSLEARMRGRAIGGCHARTPARRVLACRLALPAGATARALRTLRVIARLRVGARIVAQRRRVGAPALLGRHPAHRHHG